MMDPQQRIWGFETNFGGLAELAVVKANQLMPKPTHLTWEEAAVNALCNSTSYRMLVSRNGADMKQGDNVLVWGATGGIGGYAVQYVLNGGGTPIGVVSSPDKAAHCPLSARSPVMSRNNRPMSNAQLSVAGVAPIMGGRCPWCRARQEFSSHVDV